MKDLFANIGFARSSPHHLKTKQIKLIALNNIINGIDVYTKFISIPNISIQTIASPKRY